MFPCKQKTKKQYYLDFYAFIVLL